MEIYFLMAEAVIVNVAICGGVSYAVFRGFREIESSLIASKSMLTLEIQMLNKKVCDLQKERQDVLNRSESNKILKMEKMHDSC